MGLTVSGGFMLLGLSFLSFSIVLLISLEPANFSPILYKLDDFSEIDLDARQEVDETQMDTHLTITERYLVEWNTSRYICCWNKKTRQQIHKTYIYIFIKTNWRLGGHTVCISWIVLDQNLQNQSKSNDSINPHSQLARGDPWRVRTDKCVRAWQGL